jgi:hypothetical protein
MRFGNFFVAGILLGYAAETTLKAGLAEVLTPEERMKNGILQHNHDIVKVINECNKYGIYKDIAVSNDFLNYLNNNFQRYPSQMAKISEEAKKTNIVLCNSTDYVYYCDDFIIQLDCSLRRFTNDNATSMLYFALRTLETKYARDFLYENAFALRHYEEYEVDLNGLRLREDLKKEVIENYNKGYQYYWNGAIGDETIKRKIDEIISSYKCSDFHFQKWGDGSTIIV